MNIKFDGHRTLAFFKFQQICISVPTKHKSLTTVIGFLYCETFYALCCMVPKLVTQ